MSTSLRCTYLSAGYLSLLSGGRCQTDLSVGQNQRHYSAYCPWFCPTLRSVPIAPRSSETKRLEHVLVAADTRVRATTVPVLDVRVDIALVARAGADKVGIWVVGVSCSSLR